MPTTGYYINNHLKVAIHEPNKNCSTYKHKGWPISTIKNSNKYFTIVNMERKSNLIRTYNHIQNKQKL